METDIGYGLKELGILEPLEKVLGQDGLEKRILVLLYESRRGYAGQEFPPSMDSMITFSKLSRKLGESRENVYKSCFVLTMNSIASTYTAHGIFGIQMNDFIFDYLRSKEPKL